MNGPGRTELLSVEAAYDRWSAFYDDYGNPMVFLAAHILGQDGMFEKGSRVFEFGCGTGRNLAAMKQRGATHLAGCDLSEGMLAVARRRDSGFQLFRHDISTPLPVEGGSVDHALFCLALEHVADLPAPLAEARRIVRPDGSIRIVEIHPFLSLGGVAAHFQDGDCEIRMPAFPHRFGDYLRAFGALGLVLSRCREWRPCDVEGPLPSRVVKRGMATPLAVEFVVSR